MAPPEYHVKPKAVKPRLVKPKGRLTDIFLFNLDSRLIYIITFSLGFQSLEDLKKPKSPVCMALKRIHELVAKDAKCSCQRLHSF